MLGTGGDVIDRYVKKRLKYLEKQILKTKTYLKQFKDGNLVIEMEKTDCCCKGKEKEKKECRYLRKEFAYSKFNQTLLLPDNADRENIDAQVSNGVLRVVIPKLEKPKVEDEKRIIEVK